ncbi:MAG: aminobenzoyl-glutamate transport protein [Tenuifilum sp.]|jgi:aminobenzoyl-glutamate transport protein|uniref:AbgT family transporter n=1 Tax=Tenuifilum sp. TaxID=2760880 RepID=UPI0024AA81E6|nr:AbgT family transporter [Tenuifilum sp.]MDI3527847.1 aminobenzoyl-glutamate transport protein [Tenuifilum sp.]
MKIKKLNILSTVERVGNSLPHPAALFGIFGLITLLFSLIGAYFQWEGVNPGNGEAIKIVNLVSKEGLHRILLEMVDNYTGFAPLGIVMVAMLGIGIAESSGLIRSSINLLLVKAPKNSITFLIVLTGILSNVASDLGYILIIPIAGIIFHSLGRHPIAGMAAAFAGVSGGFSANLLIGTIDPLLAGLSTEAARIVDPYYYVMPTANYYFMFVSTFVIAITGTWVTKAIVEPRLGKYKGNAEKEEISNLSKDEINGLKWSGVTLLLFLVVIALGLIPDHGFLRGADNSILHSPILKGFIAVLFIISGTCGVVYGYKSGTFKKHQDVIAGMNSSFKGLISFLVLVFFAAQFVAWFKWSNLGLLVAVKGASFLHSADIGLIPLAILFIIISGFINMFMGSASAKWAIMGPVFIPMFMLLGYSPELSQAVFRIGDSVTNVISPMMSFFALIIVYFEKYDSKSGIGTLISTMLPYSVAFFIAWALLLIVWIILGLPLGPEAGLYFAK